MTFLMKPSIIRLLISIFILFVSGVARSALVIDQGVTQWVAAGALSTTSGPTVQSFTAGQSNIVGADILAGSGSNRDVTVSVYGNFNSMTGDLSDLLDTVVVSGVSGGETIEARWNATPITPGSVYYLAASGISIATWSGHDYLGGGIVLSNGSLYGGDTDMTFRTHYDDAFVALVPLPPIGSLFLIGLLNLKRFIRKR